MEKEKDYVKFENIPKCFYDASLDIGEWEEKLITSMMRMDKEMGLKSKFRESGEVTDVFGRNDEEANAAIVENWEEEQTQYEKNIPEREAAEKEYRESPDRINYDKIFRRFLYNKGIPMPSNEMDREIYLRERLSSIERDNLVEMIQGFSKSMLPKKFKLYHMRFLLLELLHIQREAIMSLKKCC